MLAPDLIQVIRDLIAKWKWGAFALSRLILMAAKGVLFRRQGASIQREIELIVNVCRIAVNT